MCTEWKSAVYEDALGSPGIEDLSWIEIKNECSDHVNYKLAWLKKKKLDVFMHPVFSYTS
jgi:hypothetical protein